MALQKRRTRSSHVRIRRKHHGPLKHYLVPGIHNDYRPHLLRAKDSFALAVVIVLLFCIALGIENLVVRSPSPQIGAVVASVLVELANIDREAEGLLAFSTDPTLTEAAQMKANDMAARGYFSHNTPDGKEPWYWFEKAGYDFRFAGENLAVYFSDSAAVEKAWMASPTHRANILSENYTEVGIALAQGSYQGRETTFVVQMFAAPAEALVKEGPTEIASVVPTEQTSDTVAGAAAEAAPAAPSSNSLWRMLTAPQTTLQWVYAGIALVVLLALVLLFFEWRRLHIPSLVRGAGLLVLIAVLLWSGTAYFSGELLIL